MNVSTIRRNNNNNQWHVLISDFMFSHLETMHNIIGDYLYLDLFCTQYINKTSYVYVLKHNKKWNNSLRCQSMAEAAFIYLSFFSSLFDTNKKIKCTRVWPAVKYLHLAENRRFHCWTPSPTLKFSKLKKKKKLRHSVMWWSHLIAYILSPKSFRSTAWPTWIVCCRVSTYV